MTDKKRIEFIDLAKGVCIIWVMLWHIKILPWYMPGLNSVRMPLYFMLSGLFFKTYGSILNLIIKKVNKILIPFFFFYIISYVIFHAVNLTVPGLIRSDATNILDVFTQRAYFNGPIWFLLSLFWANLFFCIIYVNIKKEPTRTAIVISFSLFGLLLGYNDVFLPMMMDNAMTALFFFWIGYKLKHTQILYPNKYDKYNLLIATSFYGMALAIDKLFGNPTFEMRDNIVQGNVVMAYLVSVFSVLSILFICKKIKYLPFVSYFGRFSIIPLCVHHLVYRPVELVVKHLLAIFDKFTDYESYIGWITASITILICYAAIPLCKKYLPYVTAQKDLIKITPKLKSNDISEWSI